MGEKEAFKNAEHKGMVNNFRKWILHEGGMSN